MKKLEVFVPLLLVIAIVFSIGRIVYIQGEKAGMEAKCQAESEELIVLRKAELDHLTGRVSALHEQLQALEEELSR